MIASSILALLSSLDERALPSMTSRPPSEQWVSIGFHDIDTDYLSSDVEGDRARGISFDAGAWWWGAQFGTAAEAQVLYSNHEATDSGITGDLETWNLMLGARLGWRGLGQHVVAYGRGGALWRADNGDGFGEMSDEGFGVYGGVGLELRLGPHIALAPDILWSWADVAGPSTQTAVGVALVVRF